MSDTTALELHARMAADKEGSTAQAARLDRILDTHGSSKSLLKEAVSGAIGTVAGFAHAGSDDTMLKRERNHFDRRLAENPSLKAKLPTFFMEAYEDRRREPIAETGLAAEVFPEQPEITPEQVQTGARV